jgi:hydroxyacylglutathione hydrolase
MLYDDKLAQAAYLIACQRTGEALVIDPERDIDRYIELAQREGVRITAIAETHIHADFLSGARELAERTGAKLFLSDEGDQDWKYQWLDSRSSGGSYDYQLLHDGDRFKVGNIRIEAVHTPGHTPEHLSYLVTDLGGGADEPIGIASGDFVFVGDVGRPDLLETAAGQAGAKEPAARALYRSLQEFNRLPDYLQVWPAHGAGSACGKALGAVPQTTVGYEKRFNLAVVTALQEEDRFVESILAGQPEPPMYFSRMKRENKMGPAILGNFPDPHPMTLENLARIINDDPDAVVLDTRSWQEFRAGHLPGSLYAPLNRTFPTVTGSYVEPHQKIYLVIEPERLREAVTDLIRIGLDNIAGHIDPPYVDRYLGTAEDAGKLLQGEIRLETTPQLKIDRFRELLPMKDGVVLDVRGAAEYEAGHIPGAINIAHTRLAARLDEIPKDRPVYVHCQAGARSAVATAYLRRNGIDAIDLPGYAELLKGGVQMQHESKSETAATMEA